MMLTKDNSSSPPPLSPSSETTTHQRITNSEGHFVGLTYLISSFGLFHVFITLFYNIQEKDALNTTRSRTNSSCLITYWKHSPWLAAITCPLCRQKVVLLDNISYEKQQDQPSKQIVHDIRDYNKRFSGQPRPFADYLYDMPLFLTLALRGIFTWGGLVWIFFLRVAVCSFGTIVCLSSPFDTKPGPLCRTLGTADDMVVISLLLICMINICQQIASNGVNMARSAAQSVLSES